jgi:hypothetical protein
LGDFDILDFFVGKGTDVLGFLLIGPPFLFPFVGGVLVEGIDVLNEFSPVLARALSIICDVVILLSDEGPTTTMDGAPRFVVGPPVLVEGPPVLVEGPPVLVEGPPVLDEGTALSDAFLLALSTV